MRVQQFDETPEHRLACNSEKAAYTSLSPSHQCQRLVRRFQRAFDVNVEREFVYDAVRQSWVVDVWHPGRPLAADKLVAVDFFSAQAAGATSACLLALSPARPLAPHPPPPPVVISDAIAHNGGVVGLPIALEGVPLVAMSHTRLDLLVKSNADPGPVTLRFRLLPDDARRRLAMMGQEFTGIRCCNETPGEFSRVKLYVMSGMVSTEQPRCCAIM